MDYDNFLNNITKYLDGELNNSEKKEFEEAMSNNSELESIYLDIKKNDKLLKKLPLIKTTPNFIVDLNNKIDKYERNKQFSILSYIKEYKNYIYRPIPALSILSVIFILSFSFIKINNFSFIPKLSNNEIINEESYIAINDSDSLNSDKDSLNYPILLIGNGR